MAESLISEDLTVEGSLDAGDTKAAVIGRIIGDVKAGSVEVKQKGTIQGSITAKTVVIEGKQTGRIHCSELARAASADVTSDVIAKSMNSEKGAKLRGKVNISGS